MPLAFLAFQASSCAALIFLSHGCGGHPPMDAGDAEASVPDALVDAPTDSAHDGVADAAEDARREFRVSLSVSPFARLLVAAGLEFDDGTTVAATLEELQSQLVDHGSTEVYARISTERAEPVDRGGEHSLESAVERARIARDLGLPLNPELGLFGSYGDVSCQTPPSFTEFTELTVPGAWETLTIEQMEDLISDFTAIVAAELLATGVEVNVWDVGNEVDFGTAGVAVEPLTGACDEENGGGSWYRAPDNIDAAIGGESVLSLLGMTETARVAWLEVHVWPHVARLLEAAATGVRSVDPGARFATHISGVSATPVAATAFYRTMAAQGLTLDELGFSFYPSSSAQVDRLADMQAMVEALRAEFGKPVFIAELAYPASPTGTGPFADWTHPLVGYPLSLEGQEDFLRDVFRWGAAGTLSGIRPWAPEVAVAGWEQFALYGVESGVTLQPRPALTARREASKDGGDKNECAPPGPQTHEGLPTHEPIPGVTASPVLKHSQNSRLDRTARSFGERPVPWP